MKKFILNSSNLEVPAVVAGCMRIADKDSKTLAKHIETCMENGVNFFDHADIYGGGQCEVAFASAMKETSIAREDMWIQSKCGIVPGVMYDLSKDYILSATDGILKRLNMEYLDSLILHRPDALVEPEEVAAAFDELEKTGKVRHFGVSNHNPAQIELLKKYVRQPLEFNQMQLSIPCSNMIAQGLEVNMTSEGSTNRDGSVLDYCRLNDITMQAWSPFQYGFFEGVFIGNEEKYAKLNVILNELAQKYNVTPNGIAVAWILRHPANIQVVVGTTNPVHLKESIEGAEVILTKEEWYKLYLAAGHILP